MEPPEIAFHEEAGGQLPDPAHHAPLAEWIDRIVEREEGTTGPVNFIFCGDEYLHRMNVEYLQHDTLTDIITFPYEVFPLVSGDLFISTERVADNARDLGLPYRDELHRVMIHGILHLCGQGDKTEDDAREMRRLENEALHLRPAALLLPPAS